jgi:YegS/Rv2252/BmrU family lipid kinase
VKDALIIVNPASAGGRTGRHWAATASRLRAAGLDFDDVLTSCGGEAVELARAAALEGRPLVVAAGGDGTTSEVANGLLAAGEGVGGTRLGVLPAGTGGDFPRMFGLPADVERAAEVLAAGHARRIDAGRVTCTSIDPGSDTILRYFVNIASAGIGGDVVDRVESGPRFLNGELTFQLASVVTLLRWRNKPVRLVVDGESREFLAQQVVVANCRYFGGGMCVAPGAVPDDGLLDVVTIGDVGRWESIRNMGNFRRGTHLEQGHPEIAHTTGRRVEVSSPERVRIEADGELPGLLPAVFEVVPKALEVIVPA